MAVVFHMVASCVLDELNCMLGRVFTIEEFHRALRQMYPTKVLGPIGKLVVFSQRFWLVVAAKLTATGRGTRYD